MRALIAIIALALAGCATPPVLPNVYPEAELAPPQYLAPIRAMMGNQMAFTNAVVVGEGAMQIEGYRADGAYKFVVMQVGDGYLLTNLERVGPAPAQP
jgi:starvation-inducible outer membrane lipoprotein